MKRIIIMLVYVNVMHAMQYDDRDQKVKEKYLLGASYFIMHRLKSCEKYWVKFDPITVNKCPEHTPTLVGNKCDTKLCKELQNGAVVVTFYDRNDTAIYEKIDEENHEKGLVQSSHYGYVGSSAIKEQYPKLDPQAKPIAAYACARGPITSEGLSLRRFDEWCCPFIYFFDSKDRLICRMPFEGYRSGEQLNQTEKAEVLQHLELAQDFSIKDERSKKGCGCCIVV